MPKLPSRRSMQLLLAVCAVGLVQTGCRPSPPAQPQTVTVLAAASTSDPVREVAQLYQKRTGVEIQVSTGPSNALAQQLINGAPAEIFLSANQDWMGEVEKSGLLIEQRQLLRNELVVIVPKDRKDSITSINGLVSDQIQKVAIAGKNVPAGMYAEQAIAAYKILSPLQYSEKVVRGHDVRQTLNFVARGEADAGIVYATDARMSTEVVVIDKFQESDHDPIIYPLGLVKSDPQNPAAHGFFEFLHSEEAITIFESYGFHRVNATGQGE